LQKISVNAIIWVMKNEYIVVSFKKGCWYRSRSFVRQEYTIYDKVPWL